MVEARANVQGRCDPHIGPVLSPTPPPPNHHQGIKGGIKSRMQTHEKDHSLEITRANLETLFRVISTINILLFKLQHILFLSNKKLLSNIFLYKVRPFSSSLETAYKKILHLKIVSISSLLILCIHLLFMLLWL